jgi:signal transduction histidine kinase
MATPATDPPLQAPAPDLPGHRWIPLAMLLALHFALVSLPGGDFQRIWLLVHFGLFLLWQPFFAAEVRLEVFAVVLLVAITATILYFVSGWMIVMWLSILLGILGGKVFTIRPARRGRLFYLAAFGYLLAMLLLWAVPALLLPGKSIPGTVALLAQVYLPLLLGVLVVLPLAREEAPRQVFDFFYAMVVFQLVVVLVLGSLALMRYTGDDYYPSVALTMLGFGTALFVLAVLWGPRAGFGGLRTYFSRYLLSVGMPFESWMRRVADLAETEPDADSFLQLALAEIAAFPWVRGARWRTASGEGGFGAADGFPTRFGFHELELTFHSVVRLSPALFLHLRLLAQVVAEFHEGKRRENMLRRNAYMQAVHETGAQLTHDIKNILQSLYALTSVAARPDAQAHAALLERQLPQLTRRLHATLEKLRAPEVATADLGIDARAWWAEVEKRHAAPEITFRGDVAEGATVPGALFDSVLENFLDNALMKRQRARGIAITAAFTAGPEGVELRVCDDGRAIDEDVARRLFREPIEQRGEAGLGIGLYQCARQAKSAGFVVELASNRDGAVCFRIAREP